MSGDRRRAFCLWASGFQLPASGGTSGSTSSFGGLMRTDRKGKQGDEVGVELKYCEHCGGLWVRECGAGVYCKRCRTKVADLPTTAKKERGPSLPVRSHTVVDDFEFEIEVEDLYDFD